MAESEREQRDFAAHYAQLSDGELVKIARESWSLSDTAWDALEDEFDRRGLELPEPEPAPTTESLEKRNLVLLRRFRDLPEALLAKGKLEAHEIPCFLADDNMVRLDWFISNLLGGVKLLVEPEEFPEAERLLNEPIPEEFDFGGEEYEQPRCPQCQSLDVSFEELYKPIAFGSLFVNFPLPVHRKGWICHKCGREWNEGGSSADPSEQTSQKPPE